MKRKTLFFAIVLGAATFASTLCPAAETVETKKSAGVVALQCYATPSGFVVSTVVTSEPQKFYDLPPLLKFNRYDPENMADSKAAVLLRAPAEGKIYVIFIVSVTSQHSLGKHDYLLHVGKDDYGCLAIGQEGEVFDQRTIEIRNKSTRVDSTLAVFMIYEIPEGSTKANFVPAIPQMSSKDFTAVEFPLPGDSNPKAPTKKTKTAAASAATPNTDEKPAAASAGAEQTAEAALTEALNLLEANQYEKFAQKFIPPEKLNTFPKDADTRAKDIETLALNVRAKLQELKNKKAEMKENGQTAVFTDGGSNKVTLVKSGNSWVLRFKK